MVKHKLLLNYDKICPICNSAFYSKNVVIKYCCKECAKTAYREQQRIASAKYQKRLKELNLKL